MITSDDPKRLTADLNRMTAEPVSQERAEQVLAEEMAWLPEGEPQQCIVEDRYWDIDSAVGAGRLHRRTILSRGEGDQLHITVEVALARLDGIELDRRPFDKPSDEIRAYLARFGDRE
jgi:hypothetical protein